MSGRKKEGSPHKTEKFLFERRRQEKQGRVGKAEEKKNRELRKERGKRR